ncbi:hypothetical protein MASR2M39_12130 [Ignavibacteriales bacterium]
MIAPDSSANKFHVFAIQDNGQLPVLRGQSLNGIRVGGDIFESSDPVFDGLYFNFLNGNKLYRIAAEENVEKPEIVSEILGIPHNFPKSNTLLIREDLLRLLIFQYNDNLIFLDVRTDEENLTRKEVSVRQYIMHGEKLHLLYSREKRRGYAVTKNAKVFRFEPSDFTNDTITLTQLPVKNFGNYEVISLKLVGERIKILVKTGDGGVSIVQYELNTAQFREYKINPGLVNIDEANVIFTKEHTLIKNSTSPDQFIKVFNDGSMVNIQIKGLYPALSVICNNKILTVDRAQSELNVLLEDSFVHHNKVHLSNGLGSNVLPSQLLATGNLAFVLTNEDLRAISF